MTTRPHHRHARPVAMAALILSTIAALSACGGGGSDSTPAATPSATEVTPTPEAPPTTSRADAYVGTWRSPCIPAVETNLSFYLEAVATKVSDTQVSVQSTTVGFAGLSCAGGVLSTGDQGTDTYRLGGTTTVGARVADKVVVTRSGADTKSLVYTDGSTLLFGDTTAGSTLDSEGYPTSLNMAYPFTRQP